MYYGGRETANLLIFRVKAVSAGCGKLACYSYIFCGSEHRGKSRNSKNPALLLPSDLLCHPFAIPKWKLVGKGTRVTHFIGASLSGIRQGQRIDLDGQIKNNHRWWIRQLVKYSVAKTLGIPTITNKHSGISWYAYWFACYKL